MDIKEIIKDTNKRISKELTYKTLSVTKCNELMKRPFDREGMSQACSKKGFDDPNSKYYQMSAQAILEAWDAKANASKHYGSLLDSYADLVLNEKDETYLAGWKLDNSFEYDGRLLGLCKGFDQFYKVLMENTNYRYLTREEKMYIKSNKDDKYINGRFDCLFYDKVNDRYLVIDWKTSGSIDKTNKFEKLLGPLYDYDACNLNEYTVQVQMYKKALCETYKITTPDKVDTYICQFSPEPFENSHNYMLYRQGFEYSSERLDDIINFSYKKYDMLNEKDKTALNN